MREKGFTLIEIMGVVIVLAIMSLIVVPLVTSSIKNSKEKLYETQLENIKSSARSYMIDLDLEENVTITLTLEELKKTGYVTKNIKNPKTGEEFNNCMLVSVSRTGEIYNYEVIDSNETTCEDNQNLIMILLGSINETAILNKEYIESGVIVKKENGQGLDTSKIKVEIKQIKDGNISQIEGKYEDLKTLIDTSDYYEYEITYIYDGDEGRASKTRNVTVKDANNLQCMILPLGIKNSTGWITDNRLVKIISVNSNKKVQYSISTTGKKQYSDEQTMDVGKDGNATLYGYIKDEDGNESVCTNTIKYEVGNPSCSINFSGTKMNNNWYISDVVASVNMNLISPLKEQGMSLNNTKNYNGQSSLTMSSSGTAYGYIKDEALKEASCMKEVNIDKTTSILTKVSGVIENTTTSYTSGSRTNKNVQLSAIVTPTTTVSGYSYQWYKDDVEITGATDINYLATESGNYKLRVTTGSGISGYSNVMELVIIKIKPTCSIGFNGTKGSNDWYLGNVNATLSWNESVIDEKDITLSSTVSYLGNTSINITESGTKIVYGYVKDEFGQEASCSDQVNVDKTTSIIAKVSGVIEDTTTSYTSGSRTNKNVQLSAIVTPTTTVSGYSYQWYKDDVEITGATDTYYLATESGNYKLRVTTGSGISGYSNVMKVVIIKIKPTCSVSFSGTKSSTGWYLGDAKATLSWNESVIEEKDITLSSTVSYLGNTSIDITGSAVKTVYGYVKDEFGQEASCSNQISVDTTTISNKISGLIENTTTSYTSGSLTNKNVELSATVSPTTSVSGYNYQWYKDSSELSGEVSKTYTATSSGTYKMIVTTGSGKVSVSNSINVIIDRTSPAIKYSIAGGVYSENIDIDVKATDTNLDYMGIVLYKNGTQYDSYTVTSSGTSATKNIELSEDATWEITTNAYDKAGNSTSSTETYYIDTSIASANITAKNLAGVIVSSGAFSNSILSVSISGTSGYDLYYCIDSNNTCTPTTQYTGSFTHSVEGTRYIRYKASKTVGGTKKESSVYSYTAKLDLTNPTVTFSLAEGAYNSAKSLTVTASDTNYKEMVVLVKKNGTVVSSWNNKTVTSTSETISLDSDGTWLVSVTATDLAGNSTSDDKTYIIDTASPTVKFSLDEGIYNSTKSLTVTASDTNYKEMSVWVKKDGTYVNKYDNITSTTKSVSLDSDGTWIIYATAIDDAGNKTSVDKTYIIDTTSPTVKFSLDGGTYNSSKSLTVTASDTNYKEMSVWVKKDGTYVNKYDNITSTTKSVSLDSDGTWIIYATAIDDAGNKTSVDKTYIIDTTSPTVKFSLDEGTYNSTKSLTVTASDTNYKEMSVWVKKDGTYLNKYDNITSTTKTVSLDSDGTWIIYVTAKDSADNSTSVNQTYKIETITASCSIGITGTQGSNGWYTGNVKATMTKVGNGSYGMRINSGSWQSVTSLSSFTASSSQQTVTGYVYPYSGSTANGVNCTTTLYYDNTAPTSVTLSVSKKTESGQYICGGSKSGYTYCDYSKIVGYTLTASGTDSESGIWAYHFYVNGTRVSSSSSNTYTDTSNLTSGAKYEVRVYNRAGLYTSKTITESCSATSSTCYGISSDRIATSSGNYSNYVSHSSGNGTITSCSTTGKAWCNLPTTIAGGGCDCGSGTAIPGGCTSGGATYQCGGTCTSC